MSGKFLSKRYEVFKSADPIDLRVAQFLGLARAANVNFVMMDGRLLMHSAHMNWNLWHTLRRCLDEIGVNTIADFLNRTTPNDRERLSDAA